MLQVPKPQNAMLQIIIILAAQWTSTTNHKFRRKWRRIYGRSDKPNSNLLLYFCYETFIFRKM